MGSGGEDKLLLADVCTQHVAGARSRWDFDVDLPYRWRCAHFDVLSSGNAIRHSHTHLSAVGHCDTQL